MFLFFSEQFCYLCFGYFGYFVAFLNWAAFLLLFVLSALHVFCPEGPPYSIDNSLCVCCDSCFRQFANEKEMANSTSAFCAVMLFIHTCPFVATGEK